MVLVECLTNIVFVRLFIIIVCRSYETEHGISRPKSQLSSELELKIIRCCGEFIETAVIILSFIAQCRYACTCFYIEYKQGRNTVLSGVYLCLASPVFYKYTNSTSDFISQSIKKALTQLLPILHSRTQHSEWHTPWRPRTPQQSLRHKMPCLKK